MKYTWENDEFIYIQTLDERGLILDVERIKKRVDGGTSDCPVDPSPVPDSVRPGGIRPGLLDAEVEVSWRKCQTEILPLEIGKQYRLATLYTGIVEGTYVKHDAPADWPAKRFGGYTLTVGEQQVWSGNICDVADIDDPRELLCPPKTWPRAPEEKKERAIKPVTITDNPELAAAVEKVIADNPKPVADIQAGKKNALNALVGQVLKIVKSNPAEVKARLESLCDSPKK